MTTNQSAKFTLDFSKMVIDADNRFAFPIKHLEEATNTPKEFRGKLQHLRGSAIFVDDIECANWMLGRSIIIRAALHGWIPEMPKELLASMFFRDDKFFEGKVYALGLTDIGTSAIIGIGNGKNLEALIRLGELGMYPLFLIKKSEVSNAKQTLIRRILRTSPAVEMNLGKSLIILGSDVSCLDIVWAVE